jgi:beta-lactamase regulating signal transducer with metallopeptidase domain
MNPLFESLLWCVLQVTLVGLLAWVMCQIISRWQGAASATIPAAALAAVVVLTASAFVPWPSWWRYGPNWLDGATAATPVSAQQLLPKMAPPGRPLAKSTAEQSDPLTDEPLAPSGGELAAASSALSSEPDSDKSSASAAMESGPSLNELAAAWLPLAVPVLLVVGIILGLLQLAGGLLSVRAYRRSSRPLVDKQLGELLDCLCAELSLASPIELRESEHLATAATVGWTKPVILLPPTWQSWSTDQQTAVLAHELAHVASGDFFACVLAQLGVALHFYHPLVHWLAARLRLEQELAADATAAQIAGGPKAYLQSLAELALHTTEQPLGWPAHTFLPTRGTFLRRIEMLRDSQPVSPARSRPGGIARWIAVGLLFLGAAAIAGLRGGPAVSPFDSAASAQSPGDGAAPTNGLDLSFVPNDAGMLLAIRPAELLKAKELRDAIPEIDRNGPWLVKLFAMEGIKQITLIGPAGVEPDDWNKDAVGIVQFVEPTTFDKLAAAGVFPADSIRLPASVATSLGRQQAYSALNDRTIALGTADVLNKYLTSRRKGQPAIAAGPAWEKVRSGAIVAALDMQLIRDQFADRPPNSAGSGPEAMIASLSPLWTDSEYVLAGVIIDGKTVHLRAIATCHDAKLAENVNDTVQAAITLARNTMRNVQANERDIAGFAQYLMQTSDALLKTVKVVQSETLVVAQTQTDLPAVKAAAAGPLAGALASARADAQRMQSMNNMKQILLAFHNWADTYGGRFPPPVLTTKDGKPCQPYSWRVAILPYIEQQALYNAYKFDEPWDSEANKKVLNAMPPIFRHPQAEAGSMNSSYYVLRSKELKEEKLVPAGAGAGAGGAALGAASGFGPGSEMGDAAGPGLAVEAPVGGFATAFSAKNGMPFAQMFDGTSNTIALVEAERDIPWTKPEDILYDPENAELPKFGGYAKEGFCVGICDGSVRFIDHKIDSKTLKALISPQGGETIEKY